MIFPTLTPGLSVLPPQGFVQRRSHDVLQASLPPKEENVLLIRMSKVQNDLYKRFMQEVEDPSTPFPMTNPLKVSVVRLRHFPTD